MTETETETRAVDETKWRSIEDQHRKENIDQELDLGRAQEVGLNKKTFFIFRFDLSFVDNKATIRATSDHTIPKMIDTKTQKEEDRSNDPADMNDADLNRHLRIKCLSLEKKGRLHHRQLHRPARRPHRPLLIHRLIHLVVRPVTDRPNTKRV